MTQLMEPTAAAPTAEPEPAIPWSRLRRDRGRRVHGGPRPVDRERGVPVDRGARSPTRRPPRSRGSCPATAWCSARCCSAPGASPTAPGAAARSSGASACSPSARSSAAPPRAPSCSSPAGSCRRSAPPSSCPPRSRCSSPPPPPRARPQAVAMWGGISALAVATGPSLGSVLIDAGGLALGLLREPPGRRARRRRRPPLAHGVQGRRPAARPRRHRRPLRSPSPASPSASRRARTGAGRARPCSARSPRPSVLGWRRGPAPGPHARGAGARPAPVRVAHRARSPTPPPSPTPSASSPCSSCNVLFLTNVWGYSTLRAGLAITPGPLVVAAAVPLDRQAGGPRRLRQGARARRARVRLRPGLVRHPDARSSRTTSAAGCCPPWSAASASPSPSPC